MKSPYDSTFKMWLQQYYKVKLINIISQDWYSEGTPNTIFIELDRSVLSEQKCLH